MVTDLVEAAATFAHGAGLDVIEVTSGVRLQVEYELMEVLRDHHVEVESLIGVGFAVAIRVAEFPDAIAAGDVDFAVHDLKSEGMVQAGGETTPGDLGQFVVDARGDENVAMERTDDGAAVGQEVEGRREHLSLPGIGHGELDVIDDVRLADLLGELAGGLDGLGPEGFGRLEQLRRKPGMVSLCRIPAIQGILDADMGNLRRSGHPRDEVSVEPFELLHAEGGRALESGDGEFSDQDRDALGRWRDLQSTHDQRLGGLGLGDLGGLVDGDAADLPAHDDLTPGIMETLETGLLRRQRSEALAGHQRRRGGIRDEAGEISGDEEGLAHGGRVVPARHEVHLGRELAGPGPDRTAEVEVVSDT